MSESITIRTRRFIRNPLLGRVRFPWLFFKLKDKMLTIE